MSAKHEITYVSAPEMRNPSQFFRLAYKDLKNSFTLGFVLVCRDIKSQYRQSLFGVIWAIFPPLILTLAFLLLKNENIIVVGDSNNGIEVFVLIGNALWQGFADALLSPLKSIHAGKSLLTKVNFAREAILLAGLFEVLFYFLIRLFIIIPMVVMLGASISATMLIAPLGMLATIALGWAVGLITIPLGTLYKDIEMGLGMIATLLYFATPAIYSPTWRTSSWLPYNPISSLIDATRDLMIGKSQSLPAEIYVISIGTVLAALVSWIVFRLAIPHLTKRLQT